MKICLNDVRLLLDYLNSRPPLIENRKRVSSFLFALLSLHCHRTEVDPTDSSFYYLTTVRTTALRITSLRQSGLCWVGVPATHPAEGVPIPVVLSQINFFCYLRMQVVTALQDLYLAPPLKIRGSADLHWRFTDDHGEDLVTLALKKQPYSSHPVKPWDFECSPARVEPGYLARTGEVMLL